ncbi:MAG: HD domain-containing protein [Clostridia bacterium]|nr:HD domain-containing protein [Clostridia bacterium]MCI2014698.1 HD domain-containing protein [Clostridia bacterium]
MDERFKKQIRFLTEIDKEKKIWRENLLSDMSRHENDAEHSFHAAVMAVVLSEYFDKDNLLKVLEMMLLHDAVEIYAGDTPAYDTEGMKSKEEREKAAADKLYRILPKDQCDKLKKLWIEFEECKTKEAKFCNIMDRMQPTMLIDALGGISWKNRNIKKEQVLNRNKITMSGPDKIREYMEDVITRAYNDGCLK